MAQSPASAKIVIEVIASMFNMSNYDTIKDIFKHLCVLLKNAFLTDEVSRSIEMILKLVVSDNLLELREQKSDDNSNNISNKPDPRLVDLYKAALYEQSPFLLTLF